MTKPHTIAEYVTELEAAGGQVVVHDGINIQAVIKRAISKVAEVFIVLSLNCLF